MCQVTRVLPFEHLQFQPMTIMRDVMREPRLSHNSIVEVLVCVVCCVLLSSCCYLEVLLFSNFLLLCVVCTH